jgi:Uma2 family endonuclease
VQKVAEYGKAGIPLYWIVELEPSPKITVLTLHDGDYVLDSEVRAGHTLALTQPFPVSFDPADLTELD